MKNPKKKKQKTKRTNARIRIRTARPPPKKRKAEGPSPSIDFDPPTSTAGMKQGAIDRLPDTEAVVELMPGAQVDGRPPFTLPAPHVDGAPVIQTPSDRSQRAAQSLGRAVPLGNGAAYHGLAGEIVRSIEPHSEADPVAVLVQTLVAFGNAVGRLPHIQIEGQRHRLNIFAALVGTTARGRKGTSWNRVKQIFQLADPQWTGMNTSSGISTGAGLLWDLRDPVKKFDPKSGQLKLVDPGVHDKRRLYIEPELAAVLARSSQVSGVLRQAWDEDCLASKVKASPITVTEPHVSIVGHITPTELTSVLRATDIRNGLANRFLWFAVEASKSLPFGGSLDSATIEGLATRLGEALQFARLVERMEFSQAAKRRYVEVYVSLGERPGSEVAQAILARAHPQVLRLSCIYALLDKVAHVELAHLEAALAVEQHSADSVNFIFRNITGGGFEERLMQILGLGSPGLARTEISSAFNGHVKAAEIQQALQALEDAGKVTKSTVPTKGRPKVVYAPRQVAENAKEAEEAEEGGASGPHISQISLPSRSAPVSPARAIKSLPPTGEAALLVAAKARWQSTLKG